jgi:transposase
MSKTRPTYTDEFRRDAVELLRTSGKPLSQVARDLGVSEASLRKWRDALLGASTGGGAGAVGDGGEPEASARELWDENVRLRREIEYLKRQREILKKAASILAEDPQLGMR